ncbi:hypothetical protein BHM03_00043710 [Ensete ventricosum]|nr:hypothetical protein BHM03_00043710 [Ensete ventricosum]
MDLDPEGIFRDDSDSESELYEVRNSSIFRSKVLDQWMRGSLTLFQFVTNDSRRRNRPRSSRSTSLTPPLKCSLRLLPMPQFVAILLMNNDTLTYDYLQENGNKETYFHVAIDCIAQSLKTQIIGRSYDEVALCFFNTVR